MSFQRSLLGMIILALIVAGLAAGLFMASYRFVTENPGGNDFLVHWVGTRAMIIDGLSPYSDEVALRIQTRAYGRPARAGEHELRVAYPLYSTLLFIPFALIGDFTIARAIWMFTLEVALIVTAFVAVRITGWQPGRVLLLLYLLFALLWYHSIRALVNGNAVILVCLFITLAFLAIKTERDELAGALLAFSTIKPQVVVVLIGFVVLWAVSHRRWLLIGWLAGGIAVLTAGAMFIIPDWLLQNLREVIRYPAYNPPGTPHAVFALWMPAVGRRIGLVLTLLLATILLIEWQAAWRKEFRWFLWTASLTLVVSAWIGIQTDPGNFIAMFPALALLFAVWDDRWGAQGKGMIVIGMLTLFAGIWWIFLRTVQYGAQPQQHPIMFFPLPLFLLLGLYWVRWWAIQPRKLWVERLRERELS